MLGKDHSAGVTRSEQSVLVANVLDQIALFKPFGNGPAMPTIPGESRNLIGRYSRKLTHPEIWSCSKFANCLRHPRHVIGGNVKGASQEWTISQYRGNEKRAWVNMHTHRNPKKPHTFLLSKQTFKNQTIVKHGAKEDSGGISVRGREF